MADYNFKQIEAKWQKEWEKKKVFEVKESKQKKYYVLDMFPYPSGLGLHMGHAFVFSLGDIFARFKRLQGFNVLYPIGYDSLGLPAENAAIKAGIHPSKYTENSIKNFMKQQKAMGWSYDWSRLVKTHDSDFYKWDQWIFLKMLEKGIAYRKKAPVNWCSKCETVLANEQVVNGKCWRHEDCNVEIKHLEQWFFRITNYAEELLSGLDKIDWPENAKKLQRNWIGKSSGAEILFDIKGENWPVFTTRPDTLYGVTFLIVSAQHSRLNELITEKQKKDVEIFLKKIKSTSEKDLGELEKEGVFTGTYAIHPLTKEKIPVYAGNFVLADYGSGMVMAVPAHDQRDFEFAKKYGLPIKEVIVPSIIPNNEKDFPKKNKPTVERRTVVAILKHWEKDEIYCLDWEKFGWKSFVIGGVDNNENSQIAAIRELKEETGYQNFNFVKKIGGKVFSKFYAEHKGENRVGEMECYYFELKNGKSVKPKEEHIKNHKGVWIKKENVSSFINLSPHHHYWDIFEKGEKAFTEEGILVNSGVFNGLSSDEAKEHIIKNLSEKKLGKKTINYKLRDWLISRQRYWGTPIPVVYCEKCGIVPIPEKDLPVLLPEKVQFGKGNPLLTNEKWIKVKCPKCEESARRETDTMDTFVNSSWYFLRYSDAKNNKQIFDTKKVDYWCPIDQYIGGPEHITMHLIYARFYTKFLRDLGLLKFDEPALRYFTQGIVHGTDGEKMSKSRGNIVEPFDMINKYGADTLRLALVSFAAPDKDSVWEEKIILGSHKFLNKVYGYFSNFKPGESESIIQSKLHRTIKEVTIDIENFKHNLAIIKIRQLFESFENKKIDKETAKTFLKLLHIYCPFITEELWKNLGNKNFISFEKWPVYDEKKIDKNLEEKERQIEKTVEDVLNIMRIIKEKSGEDPKNAYIYVLPNELNEYLENLDLIKKRTSININVFSVADKNKHDPQGKSAKVKPGKPGIYLE